MGRAERRQMERMKARDSKKQTIAAAKLLESDIKRKGIFDANTALSNPYYMTQIVNQRITQRKAMEKNGITEADLKAEYEKGYAVARRDLTVYAIRMFCAATAISLHRLHKFGESRIARVLEDVQCVMNEEICTDDILDRCKAETGIDIRCGDYD